MRLDALELRDHVGVPRANTSGLNLQGNPELKELSFASLTAIGSVTKPAGIGIFQSPKVQTLSVPKLQQFGSISIARSVLTVVSMPALTELGELAVEANATLTSVSFPALKRVNNTLFITGNALLGTVDVSSLRTIGSANSPGRLEVRDNLDLTKLALPALEKCKLAFEVTDNPSLETLEIASGRTAFDTPFRTILPEHLPAARVSLEAGRPAVLPGATGPKSP